jgi:lipopolysaccharide/colanic/teichoic acid biosynthesis glycosyltransferase
MQATPRPSSSPKVHRLPDDAQTTERETGSVHQWQPIVVGRETVKPPRLLDPRWRLAKRAFDIALSLLLLPFALPLMGLVAFAVRIDSPGPIIFKQQRTGRNGKRFSMFKFRTMVENAEELKVTYAHLNILQPPDFKIPNDPRITRVGRILRKTSLDEIPQLFNIALGHMSFVGPRPTSFASATYDIWHGERLDVTPGLTGIWQIKARGESEFDDRLRLDIEYIRTWSLWLDVKLLFLTVFAVVKQRGAH